MLTELVDPKWWFSAVVVAVLVNMLSAYLKHPLDRLMRFLGGTYRRHSKRGREHWEGRLELAKSSDRALLVEVAREIRYRSKATLHILVVLASGALVVAIDASPTPIVELSRVFLILMVISAVSGFVNFIRAMDVHYLVIRSVERSADDEVKLRALMAPTRKGEAPD